MIKEAVSKVLNQYLDDLINHLPDAITGMVLFVLIYLLGRFLGNLWRRSLQKDDDSKIVAEFARSVTIGISVIIGTIVFLHVMGFGGIASSLVAGAGVSAVVFGFAFKDIAENFLAGVIILFDRPFNSGDVIEIDGHKGTVITVEMRSTEIRTLEGKNISIPNSMIIKSVLTNYTKDGLLRLDFSVGIDQNENVQKARKLIHEVMAREPDVLKTPPPFVIISQLGVSSLDIKVMFWIDTFSKGAESAEKFPEPVLSRVIGETKEILLKNDFTLPSNILELKSYGSDGPIKVSNE